MAAAPVNWKEETEAQLKEEPVARRLSTEGGKDQLVDRIKSKDDVQSMFDKDSSSGVMDKDQVTTTNDEKTLSRSEVEEDLDQEKQEDVEEGEIIEDAESIHQWKKPDISVANWKARFPPSWAAKRFITMQHTKKCIVMCNISMADLSHPIMLRYLQLSTSFKTSFYPCTENAVTNWNGIMRIYFAKEAEVADALRELPHVREGLEIRVLFPYGSTLKKMTAIWNAKNIMHPENVVQKLLIVQGVAKVSYSEREAGLWQIFSDAYQVFPSPSPDSSYAFIVYNDIKLMKKALEKDGSLFHGSKLEVQAYDEAFLENLPLPLFNKIAPIGAEYKPQILAHIEMLRSILRRVENPHKIEHLNKQIKINENLLKRVTAKEPTKKRQIPNQGSKKKNKQKRGGKNSLGTSVNPTIGPASQVQGFTKLVASAHPSLKQPRPPLAQNSPSMNLLQQSVAGFTPQMPGTVSGQQQPRPLIAQIRPALNLVTQPVAGFTPQLPGTVGGQQQPRSLMGQYRPALNLVTQPVPGFTHQLSGTVIGQRQPRPLLVQNSLAINHFQQPVAGFMPPPLGTANDLHQLHPPLTQTRPVANLSKQPAQGVLSQLPRTARGQQLRLALLQTQGIVTHQMGDSTGVGVPPVKLGPSVNNLMSGRPYPLEPEYEEPFGESMTEAEIAHTEAKLKADIKKAMKELLQGKRPISSTQDEERNESRKLPNKRSGSGEQKGEKWGRFENPMERSPGYVESNIKHPRRKECVDWDAPEPQYGTSNKSLGIVPSRRLSPDYERKLHILRLREADDRGSHDDWHEGHGVVDNQTWPSQSHSRSSVPEYWHRSQNVMPARHGSDDEKREQSMDDGHLLDDSSLRQLVHDARQLFGQEDVLEDNEYCDGAASEGTWRESKSSTVTHSPSKKKGHRQRRWQRQKKK